MATQVTDLQVSANQQHNSNLAFQLTDKLIEAMNRTIDVLVRAGATSKSIDQKRLAWEVIKYLRAEAKDGSTVNRSGADLAKAITALMPSPSVNVQVNVDNDAERRALLKVRADNGLNGAIRDRARNHLAKLDAAAGRPSIPPTITANQVENNTPTEPIQAAEKPDGERT